MNRKNRIKTKKNIHIFISGILVLFITCLTFLLLNNEKEEYKNVKISIFDDSLNKENSSGKIIIDNKKLYEFDNISKNLNYKVSLKKGKHIIQVSTTSNKYILNDTIEIIDYPQFYDLNIRYNYNPPLKEHLNYIAQKLKTKKYRDKYSDEQEKFIIRNTKKNYKSSDRCFSLDFWKKPLLE